MMIVVGLSKLRTPKRPIRSDVRMSRQSAPYLAPRLIGWGEGVGLLSGFFGFGGGILVVPALLLATSMTMIAAVGSSLVSVTAFGATTGVKYALPGLVDLRIVVLFIVGGVRGAFAGVTLSGRLALHKQALRSLFAGGVTAVGLYVVVRGAAPLLHGL